jgi:hypothetical protein
MAILATPGESRRGTARLTAVRPLKTAEDFQLADRGWLLTAPYLLGSGISLVQGFLRGLARIQQNWCPEPSLHLH